MHKTNACLAHHLEDMFYSEQSRFATSFSFSLSLSLPLPLFIRTPTPNVMHAP